MGDVIDIGGFSIVRKNKPSHYDLRTTKSICQHLGIVLDPHGDVVTCEKCGVQLSAFWALAMLTDRWAKAQEEYLQKTMRLQKDTEKSLHLLAARRLEESWRSQTSVPACPHCHLGILPSDALGGYTVSKKGELARREAEKAAKNPLLIPEKTSD